MPLGLGINGSTPPNSSQSGNQLLMKPCIKCPNEAKVVINKKDTYCKECFLNMVSHKFRGTLGRQRVFNDNKTKVMIAFDGGPSSVTLLKLVQAGLSAHVTRKLMITPVIVTVLPFLSVPELKKYSAKLFAFVDSSGLEWHVTHLGSVFAETVEAVETISDSSKYGSATDLPGFDTKSREKLERIFGSSNVSVQNPISNTCKQDLWRRFKMALLYRIAEKYGMEKIMTAETATNLSKRVLNHLTLGRGPQISPDSALLDRRHPKVTVVRGLREFSAPEVAYFNHYEDLEPPLLITAEGRSSDEISGPVTNGGLEEVTGDFVDGLLNAGFSGTVASIMSSAGKVQGWVDSSKSGEKEKLSKCRLCFSDIRQTESNPGKDLDVFCYGCSSILAEVGDKSLLPDWLNAN